MHGLHHADFQGTHYHSVLLWKAPVPNCNQIIKSVENFHLCIKYSLYCTFLRKLTTAQQHFTEIFNTIFQTAQSRRDYG